MYVGNFVCVEILDAFEKGNGRTRAEGNGGGKKKIDGILFSGGIKHKTWW